MLIVGSAALVAPMVISKSTVRKDIPFAMAAAVLLTLLTLDGTLSRIDGLVLLAGFAAFMYYTLSQTKASLDEHDTVRIPKMSSLMACVYIVGGLLGLILGSNLFVDAASDMAYSLGVSEGVVGLTVVAGGTSLPELATSVVAARKGQSAIAIGNVIGSNVFNILLILGTTAALTPLEIEGITTIDMAVMLLSVFFVWLFSRTRYTVERWEGGALLLGYLAYLGWMLYSL